MKNNVSLKNMLCKNVMLSTLYEGLIFYIYYLKALYGAKACPQL